MFSHIKQASSELLIFGCQASKDLEYPNCYIGSMSKLVKHDISRLKSTAHMCQTCSLSANQISSQHNFFLIRQKLKTSQWVYKERGTFTVFLNPRILKVSPKIEEDWEYCSSFPCLRAKVARFEKIKVEYEDESLKTKEKELEGFIARLFQHELDHLRGITMINWRMNHLGLEFLDKRETEENRDILQAIGELQEKIEEMKLKFPKKFRRKLDDLNTRDIDETNENYFDLDVCRKEMQELGFEEESYQKLRILFGRKLAFENV